MSSPVQALGKPLSSHSPPPNPDDRDGPSQSGPSYSSGESHSNLRPTAASSFTPADGGASYSLSDGQQTMDMAPLPSSNIHHLGPSVQETASQSSASTLRSSTANHNAPLGSRSASNPNVEREETLRNSSPEDRAASDDFGEPSEQRMKQSAVIGTTIPGPAGPEKRHLAEGGGRVPQGWKEVDMPEKHHLWHRQVAGPRTKVIKVSFQPFGVPLGLLHVLAGTDIDAASL